MRPHRPPRPRTSQNFGAYKLPCKYVIHTSGPVWRGGLLGESIILRSCYLESLKLAVENNCQSMAFPLISSGVYGYPKDQVLKFAIQTITEFLFDHELTVYICVFDKESYTFSQKLFNDIRAFIDDEYVDEHDEDYYDAYCAEDEKADCGEFLASTCMRQAPRRIEVPIPSLPSRAASLGLCTGMREYRGSGGTL